MVAKALKLKSGLTTKRFAAIMFSPKLGKINMIKLSNEFKYYWPQYIGKTSAFEGMVDNEGYSISEYQDVTSEWNVLETVSRWGKPISFWRELKIVIVSFLHGTLDRWGFKVYH